MLSDFIFGAAYYEEYLPEDRLEKDLRLIREAGMNTLRIAESTWSVEEPVEGQYDFSHVTRVIEAAARHGLKVIVGTPTYAVPPWLGKKPGVLGGNAFGSRQNMDITDPTYRYYAEKIIRALVSATADYANVIGFQIDNETKHYGVHSPTVISGFQDWLKRRFGSIEAVNDAFELRHWSCSVSSFEELPDPVTTVHGGYACAFEEYRRELAVEFLRWQSDIVREYKHDRQFITHNFDFEWRFFGAEGQQDGRSAGLQPDQNCYAASKTLDIVGTDIYCPTGDALTGMEIALGGDLMRSLKHAPYIVLESQAQAFTGWLPYPGQLRLMALTHIASGAAGLMYWPWLSIPGGIESYWKGVLSHDGEPGETYEEVKQIGKELSLLWPKLSGMKKDNRIAMIVSPEALHALRRFPTDKEVSYNDVLAAIYRALYELNLECDILYDREEDWSGYRLLVFPQLYTCSDHMIQRVRRFVENGGTVIASFRSFFADENAKIRHDRQPHGLTDVFGMGYSRFTKDAAHYWMELLEPDTAEAVQRYQHRYWNRYASITRNAYGRGFAWYLGVMPSRAVLKDCLVEACGDAGIEVPELRWPLVCRTGIDELGKTIRFIMNYSEDEQTMNAPCGSVDLLTGKKYCRNDMICVHEWNAIILCETGKG